MILPGARSGFLNVKLLVFSLAPGTLRAGFLTIERRVGNGKWKIWSDILSFTHILCSWPSWCNPKFDALAFLATVVLVEKENTPTAKSQLCNCYYVTALLLNSNNFPSWNNGFYFINIYFWVGSCSLQWCGFWLEWEWWKSFEMQVHGEWLLWLSNNVRKDKKSLWE